MGKSMLFSGRPPSFSHRLSLTILFMVGMMSGYLICSSIYNYVLWMSMLGFVMRTSEISSSSRSEVSRVFQNGIARIRGVFDFDMRLHKSGEIFSLTDSFNITSITHFHFVVVWQFAFRPFFIFIADIVTDDKREDFRLRAFNCI